MTQIEYVAQMGPMLLLAGVAAGWVSEAVSRARGYGFIYDMALGIVGSLLAGVIVSVLISSDAGMATMFAIGCCGASLAIVAQRQLWRSARPAT
jgi:uncharacterized membrane protein YeaQ/YmgE (transglycosylase-associated protein family)